MAAAFWYYPNDTGQAVKIPLSRPIVDRSGAFQRMEQSTTQAWSGQISTTQWGGPDVITVKHQWGGMAAADRLIRRNLVAFVNHLRRGGRCVFAEDDTKLYAAFVQVIPSPGDTAISIFTPITDTLQAINSASGQEVILRSCAPDCIQEACLVSSQTGSGISFSQGVSQDFTDQAWVLLRQWGSWPAMRLPTAQRSSDLLMHDHEISFSLELTLEEDEAVLNNLSIGGVVLPSETGIGGSVTLEDSGGGPGDGGIIGGGFGPDLGPGGGFKG